MTTREGATAFVFAAQGTQWPGMGRDLLASDAVFRDAIVRCDASIRRHFDWSLRREMEAVPESCRIHRDHRMVQPALTSLQIALAETLIARGVTANAVGALSMGEIAAAHSAGMIDLREAIDIACSTARLAETELRPGLMAFVRASWPECTALIADVRDRVGIAVELGPQLTVISGEANGVQYALSIAVARGTACGPLPLAQAYHSPDVASLGDVFRQRLAHVRSRPGAIDSYSSVTAAVERDLNADHLWRICSEPARFYSLALAMIRDGYRNFIEISPHPMLAQTIEEAAAHLGVTVNVQPVMQRGAGAMARALSPPSVVRQTAIPLDLYSDDVRRDPYPYYRRLREERPVAFLERLQWYAVTRRADVERIVRSPELFSSTIMRSADRALLGKDPPAHTSVRKIVASAFDAARTRALEERVAVTARSLVGTFVNAGGGDFVQEIAVELPVHIIAHLLGIDEDRLPEFKEWSEAVVIGASGMTPPGREIEVARLVEDFDQLFAGLIERRRQRPGSDMISALLQASGAALAEEDVRSLAKLLLIGGNETTTNLMSNAMLALFTIPGLEERVREQPRLCGALVEETLRFDAPVQIILRRSTQEVELSGARIPKGGVVAAVIGSANRDESHHADADTFRLGRTEPHLAFGAGPHYCLGASLARLEATLALSTLLAETRCLEPTETLTDIPRVASLQLRGLQRLLMRAS